MQKGEGNGLLAPRFRHRWHKPLLGPKNKNKHGNVTNFWGRKPIEMGPN